CCAHIELPRHGCGDQSRAALLGEGDVLFSLCDQGVDLGGLVVEVVRNGPLLFERRDWYFKILKLAPSDGATMIEDPLTKRLCQSLKRPRLEYTSEEVPIHAGPCNHDNIDRAAHTIQPTESVRANLIVHAVDDEVTRMNNLALRKILRLLVADISLFLVGNNANVRY